ILPAGGLGGRRHLTRTLTHSLRAPVTSIIGAGSEALPRPSWFASDPDDPRRAHDHTGLDGLEPFEKDFRHRLFAETIVVAGKFVQAQCRGRGIQRLAGLAPPAADQRQAREGANRPAPRYAAHGPKSGHPDDDPPAGRRDTTSFSDAQP